MCALLRRVVLSTTKLTMCLPCGDTLYALSEPDDALRVTALDLTTGRVRWKAHGCSGTSGE